jgi:hypothetical protein
MKTSWVIEIFTPDQMPALLLKAYYGDEDAWRMTRLVEMAIRDRLKDQLCMLCEHEFTSLQNIAAWVILSPIKPFEQKVKICCSGLCERCLAAPDVESRIIRQMRHDIAPDLEVMGYESDPGHA